MSQKHRRTVSCRDCGRPTRPIHKNEEAICNDCLVHQSKRISTRKKVYSCGNRGSPQSPSGSLCKIHNKTIKYWCEDCQEVACTRCKTSEHNDHDLDEITDALCWKQEQLVDETKTILQDWEERLRQVDANIAPYVSAAADIDEKLMAQAEKIHKALDSELSTRRSQLGDIKKKNINQVRDQKNTLEDGIKKIKTTLKNLKELSGVDEEEYMRLDIDNIRSVLPAIPKNVAVLNPITCDFEKGMVEQELLGRMLGALSLRQSEQRRKPETTVLETSHHTEHRKASHITSHGFSSAQADVNTESFLKSSNPLPDDRCLSGSPYSSSSQPRNDKLMRNPKVISSFRIDFDFPFITCASEGTTWLRSDPKSLQLVNIHGLIISDIFTGFDINGIAYTPMGDVILSDSSNHRIVSVSQTKGMSTLFRTEHLPWGICSLQSGHIVVAFRNENTVTEYNRNGREMYVYNSVRIRRPRELSENKINKDLYICNEKNSHKHWEGTVVVFDLHGEFRYKYTGLDSGEFDPKDVCTDLEGNVLITDANNHMVHILDKDGKFLQYLEVRGGLKDPKYIDTDSDKNVWIWQSKINRVKVVEYLNE